jgi:hypothetical protein
MSKIPKFARRNLHVAQGGRKAQSIPHDPDSCPRADGRLGVRTRGFRFPMRIQNP